MGKVLYVLIKMDCFTSNAAEIFNVWMGKDDRELPAIQLIHKLAIRIVELIYANLFKSILYDNEDHIATFMLKPEKGAGKLRK